MCVCFFKDLGSSDLRKDVYVVAHIIRIGKSYWMHYCPEFSKKHHAFLCMCIPLDIIYTVEYLCHVKLSV